VPLAAGTDAKRWSAAAVSGADKLPLAHAGRLAKLQPAKTTRAAGQRAGLQPWPHLFHALRASRETELAREYPIHVVRAWLGNIPRIAVKHHLQVTDADFARAS
jgi:hypothetical protein